MKRKISAPDLKQFINDHYSSKSDFARKLEISWSHLDSLLKGKLMLGEKVGRRLEELCKVNNYEFELLLEPIPIQLPGGLISHMTVVDDKGEFIACITSREVICKNGYIVECVPYE